MITHVSMNIAEVRPVKIETACCSLASMQHCRGGSVGRNSTAPAGPQRVRLSVSLRPAAHDLPIPAGKGNDIPPQHRFELLLFFLLLSDYLSFECCLLFLLMIFLESPFRFLSKAQTPPYHQKHSLEVGRLSLTPAPGLVRPLHDAKEGNGESTVHLRRGPS